MFRKNSVYNIDCLDGMACLADKSIDMIFCDLPYGITAQNRWDKIIDPELLWQEYERIIKDNGAIVLFGTGMFTAKMMTTRPKLWRYNLIWEKTTPTGFLNANRMPLRTHEDIMVFYRRLPVYHPQKSVGHDPVHQYEKHTPDGSNYGKTKIGVKGGGSTERFPTSVWKFSTDKQKESIHPVQKPIELCRNIIRTYTDPGDVVLDNCCGSGSILAAAKLEDRDFIGMDNGVCDRLGSEQHGKTWAEISINRLKNTVRPNLRRQQKEGCEYGEKAEEAAVEAPALAD